MKGKPFKLNKLKRVPLLHKKQLSQTMDMTGSDQSFIHEVENKENTRYTMVGEMTTERSRLFKSTHF